MFCVLLHFFRSILVRNSAIRLRMTVIAIVLVNSSVNKLLDERAWKGGWSMVYRPCSLVWRQIYHQSISFLSQDTIESMVNCLHLPNLVNAGWLWRITRGALNQSKTTKYFIWMNNNSGGFKSLKRFCLTWWLLGAASRLSKLE